MAVDFERGTVEDLSTGETFQTAPFPGFIQHIIDSGGLLESLKTEGG